MLDWLSWRMACSRMGLMLCNLLEGRMNIKKNATKKERTIERFFRVQHGDTNILQDRIASTKKDACLTILFRTRYPLIWVELLSAFCCFSSWSYYAKLLDHFHLEMDLNWMNPFRKKLSSGMGETHLSFLFFLLCPIISNHSIASTWNGRGVDDPIQRKVSSDMGGTHFIFLVFVKGPTFQRHSIT